MKSARRALLAVSGGVGQGWDSSKEPRGAKRKRRENIKQLLSKLEKKAYSPSLLSLPSQETSPRYF